MTYAYLDAPAPLAFAHRGGAVDGVENSIPAFERAVRMGYRYLETDVHATVDGVLIAFHDEELDRVTDRVGRVAELSWSQISEARIGGREPIPLFADLLRRFPSVRFNVDPKSDAAVEPLLRIVSREAAEQRVLVGSFDQRRLLRVRRALPDMATSMGPWEVRALKAASKRLLPRFAVPRWAACVQVPEYHNGTRIVDRPFVDTAHACRLGVHVWTVNDRLDMHRLLNLGVDGIVTDDLVALREVLSERGGWTGDPSSASLA